MKETFGNYIDVIHAYHLISFRNSITDFNTYKTIELLKRIHISLIILKCRFPSYVSDEFITLIKSNSPNIKCTESFNNMIYTTDIELPYIQPTFRSNFDIIEGIGLLKLLTKFIYNKLNMSICSQDNCIETVSKSLLEISYNTCKLQITDNIKNMISESLIHDTGDADGEMNIDTYNGIVNININDTVNLASLEESIPKKKKKNIEIFGAVYVGKDWNGVNYLVNEKTNQIICDIDGSYSPIGTWDDATGPNFD